MHFEILVEGQSDRTALEPILTKILGSYGNPHTWTIHRHRGLGNLPSVLTIPPNRKDQTLLHNLPYKLRAYGKSLTHNQSVVVLVDLDDKDCLIFKKSMVNLLSFCNPAPKCLFRIAIEELEAWFLGDRKAFLIAYPKARTAPLISYVQDSICGTWELIADSTYPGGSRALKKKGDIPCLAQKRIWAKDIAPHMDIENNLSPSFKAFREGIRRLVNENN